MGWLPLYHDMGLVVQVVLALVGHMPSVFMDPLAFIQQPARWLRLLSRHTGAMTAAPNFAYDYCVRRLDETERSELSLASVAAMANGSEPVSPATIERFHAAFAPVGVTRTAVRPSYGLAEARVFVSASPAGERPRSPPSTGMPWERASPCRRNRVNVRWRNWWPAAGRSVRRSRSWTR